MQQFRIYLISPLLSLLFIGCEKDDIKRHNEEIDEVYSGSSFELFDNLIEFTSGMVYSRGDGLVIVGGANSTVPKNIRILKLDEQLNTIWLRSYGNDHLDRVQTIYRAFDGGYLFGGHTAYEADGLVIKTDYEGNKYWSSTFGTSQKENIRDIHKMPDDHYLIAGTTYQYIDENDLYFAKLDLDGNVVKSKTVELFRSDVAHAIHPIIGGYIISCLSIVDSISQGTYPDQHKSLSLIKINNDLKVEWSRTVGNASWHSEIDVIKTRDDHLLAIGSHFFDDDNENTSDIQLVKMTFDGDVKWKRTYGGEGYDRGISAYSEKNGYYILGNTSSYGNGAADICLIKTDEFGNRVWFKTYGGENHEFGRGIVNTGLNEVELVLSGNKSNTENNEYAMFLMRVDEQGVPQ